MRERLLHEGMDSLQDHEVLEILLFFAIPRQDTNELAHRLLLRFHTLSGVFDAPFEELRRVEGVGRSGSPAPEILSGSGTPLPARQEEERQAPLQL